MNPQAEHETIQCFWLTNTDLHYHSPVFMMQHTQASILLLDYSSCALTSLFPMHFAMFGLVLICHSID